ncbi:MAG: DtxR family transcriptional regulator [Thermodesulfobacteriota bacterium]|nr:DtxR family transcriptional regulator [Thermodesulfobacteriota bacterium]
MEVLTPSLEDYLEAIWTISLREKVARVKDIAKCLAVTTPSVVSALNVLAEKNLIKHERYGYIELTNQGATKAKEVGEYHQLLFNFLHEILGVDNDTAYHDACKIEHHLSKEAMKRMRKLIQFFEKYPDEKNSFISKFQQFIKMGEEGMKSQKEKEDLTLKDLKPGERGKVIKIKGKGELKKRLLDMGIVPGAEIKLEKVAPLGDPIDILIKGYHLSLRKDEAKDILINRS